MRDVLIVEDILSDRRLLRAIVESLGFSAIEVADGDSAAKAIILNPQIALVLTDIVMPALDGVSLTHHLRAKGIGIPIIVTSSRPLGPKAAAELLDLGAVRILPKPIDRGAMEREVRSLTSGEGS